jgi:tetratricopeptide (TPR) repeat protein
MSHGDREEELYRQTQNLGTDAEVLYRAQRYSEAIPLLGTVIKRYEQLNLHKDRAYFLTLLAHSFDECGEPDHAIVCYRGASDIYKTYGPAHYQGLMSLKIAAIFEKYTNRENAAWWWADAERIYRSIGDAERFEYAREGRVRNGG